MLLSFREPISSPWCPISRPPAHVRENSTFIRCPLAYSLPHFPPGKLYPFIFLSAVRPRGRSSCTATVHSLSLYVLFRELVLTQPCSSSIGTKTVCLWLNLCQITTWIPLFPWQKLLILVPVSSNCPLKPFYFSCTQWLLRCCSAAKATLKLYFPLTFSFRKQTVVFSIHRPPHAATHSYEINSPPVFWPDSGCRWERGTLRSSAHSRLIPSPPQSQCVPVMSGSGHS